MSKSDGGDKNEELLAQFHDTISQQLDSRLSESPKFFGLLVVISTGYASVIAGHTTLDAKLLMVATLLTYATGIWATWYLAALGYAFRFLQHTQHRIECELGWDKFTLKSANTSKENVKKLLASKSVWRSYFWLLPSIYHGHIAGMMGFFGIICFTFGCYGWTHPTYHGMICIVSLVGFLAGISWVFACNRIYLRKYCTKLEIS